MLSSQPSLLSKCVSALSSAYSWEPELNYRYLTGLTYLIFLLNTTELDAISKSTLKKVRGLNNGIEKSAAIEGVISHMFPSSLGKKELTRILQCSASLVQHTGMLLLLAFLKRMKRLISSKDFISEESSLGVALMKYLPDFSLLLSLRAK